MGNSMTTHTHTCLKPVPALTGTGFDGCGHGYSRVAWVPKPVWVWTTGSMRCGKEGRTFSVASIRVFDTAGREKPSPSRRFEFFDAGERNLPATSIRVCGVVAKGVGEQLGRGGRELELYHNIFNLKTNLSWGWAQQPIPTLVAKLCSCPALVIPSPPSHLRVVVLWGSCPRHGVASVIVWSLVLSWDVVSVMVKT